METECPECSSPAAQGDGKTAELLPCPFCGVEMEKRDVLWTSHPRNNCVLEGGWFKPEKWNKRVSPGTAANKTEADSGIKEA